MKVKGNVDTQEYYLIREEVKPVSHGPTQSNEIDWLVLWEHFGQSQQTWAACMYVNK